MSLLVKLIVLLFFATSLVLRLARQDRRHLTDLLLLPVATGLLTAGSGIGAGTEGGFWFGALGGLLAGTLLLVTGLVLIGALLGLVGFASVIFSDLAPRWHTTAAFLSFFVGASFICLALGIARPAFGLLLILLIAIGGAYAAAISDDTVSAPTHQVRSNEDRQESSPNLSSHLPCMIAEIHLLRYYFYDTLFRTAMAARWPIRDEARKLTNSSRSAREAVKELKVAGATPAWYPGP